MSERTVFCLLVRALKVLLLGMSVLLCPRLSWAESTSDNASARARFKEGLAHVQAERYAEAVVAFEQAYAQAPKPAVLYNLGLAYELAERPVDAYQCFERYLAADGATMPPERRSSVAGRLERLKPRVGFLSIAGSGPVTNIRVDGNGLDPLAKEPLVVAPGAHLVTYSVPGSADLERSISVAPGATVFLELAVQMPASAEARLSGAVRLHCAVPGVNASIDGRALTDITQPVFLAPGSYEVHFQRQGYLPDPDRQKVHVESSSETDVRCRLKVRADLAPSASSMLHVSAEPADAAISINSTSSAPSARLPIGVHQVSVSRLGFITQHRRVVLKGNDELTLNVALPMSKEYALETEQRRATQLTLAYVLGGVGLAFGIASAALAVDNGNRYDKWQTTQRVLDAEWKVSKDDDPALLRRQASNDELHERVQLVDRIAIGGGVGAGVLLAVATGLTLFPTTPALPRLEKTDTALMLRWTGRL